MTRAGVIYCRPSLRGIDIVSGVWLAWILVQGYFNRGACIMTKAAPELARAAFVNRMKCR